MLTPSGLVELQSGWTIGVTADGPDRVRMFLVSDPEGRRPVVTSEDVQVALTFEETSELAWAFGLAAGRSHTGA